MPYRTNDKEQPVKISERVIYSIHPWAAVVILLVQSITLTAAIGIAHDIVAPQPAVTKTIRFCPQPSETSEEHARAHRADVALCDRACHHNYVAVHDCVWVRGGTRQCACTCGSGTNDVDLIREQR